MLRSGGCGFKMVDIRQDGSGMNLMIKYISGGGAGQADPAVAGPINENSAINIIESK